MSRIKANIRMLPVEQGGRSISDGEYRPHFRVGDGELLGVRVSAPNGIQAGAVQEVTVELLYPGVDYSPLQPGVEFSVFEGPSKVGVGEVVGAC